MGAPVRCALLIGASGCVRACEHVRLCVGHACVYIPPSMRACVRGQCVSISLPGGLAAWRPGCVRVRPAWWLQARAHESNVGIGAPTAGDSPFHGAWRNMQGDVHVLIKSGANTIALYNNVTDQWTGFAPDFLRLLSNDLIFAYDIIDLNHVCSVELVEAFRAFLRSPRGLTCSAWNITASYVMLCRVPTCCAVLYMV